jgi:hypothetical protein
MLALAPVLVVDWNCPQGSGAWADEQGAFVEREQESKRFHKTRALNRGAEAAIKRGATEFWFLDADTLIEDEEAFSTGLWNWDRRRFAVSADRDTGLVGVLLCTTPQFQRSGGFDEGCVGWGWEDIEMRLRLACKLGLDWDQVQGLRAIEHDEKARTLFYRCKNKWTSNRLNRLRTEQRLREWTGEGFSGLSPAVQTLLPR